MASLFRHHILMSLRSGAVTICHSFSDTRCSFHGSVVYGLHNNSPTVVGNIISSDWASILLLFSNENEPHYFKSFCQQFVEIEKIIQMMYTNTINLWINCILSIGMCIINPDYELFLSPHQSISFLPRERACLLFSNITFPAAWC